MARIYDELQKAGVKKDTLQEALEAYPPYPPEIRAALGVLIEHWPSYTELTGKAKGGVTMRKNR